MSRREAVQMAGWLLILSSAAPIAVALVHAAITRDVWLVVTMMAAWIGLSGIVYVALGRKP
jgi:hypothetical protein